MKKKNMLRNEEGFTLIEIIAVLVVLGVLAAVAMPKFINLTEDAKEKAIEGAYAAAFSNATLTYSQHLLKTGKVPTGITTSNEWTDGETDAVTTEIETDLGDYAASYAYALDASTGIATVTVTITRDPDGAIAEADRPSKAFKIKI